MLLNIVLFEVKTGLRKLSFWIYCLVFFSISFLIVNIMGGAIIGSSMVMDNTKWNSPYMIAGFQTFFTIFGAIVCSAIFGNSAYRDYETNMHPLFFTKPIRPSSYYLGRFSGALLLNIMIQLSVSIGLLFGFLMPYLDQEVFGPLRFDAFIQPFLVFVIPNLFFIGSIIFTLAIVTRRMLPTYLGTIILFLGYATAGTLMMDMETRWLAGLLDPFCDQAVEDAIRYWTPTEKNNLLLPISGWVLLNRIIWISIGIIFLLLGIKRFDFEHVSARSKKKKKLDKTVALPEIKPLGSYKPIFKRSTHWIQFKNKVLIEIRRAFLDPYFLGILATAIVFIILNQWAGYNVNGIKVLPVTDRVISRLLGSLNLFMLIIVIFYSGQIIWKEKELKADSILDAHPVPNWIPMLAKMIALILIPAIILFIVMILGVLIQTWFGFYDYEISLYLKRLFLLKWTELILLCILAFTVQTLVTNKYLGHFIIILHFLFGMFRGMLDLNHTLYFYGSGSGATYSDLNGFSPYLSRLFWYKLYWGSFAVFLALLSNLFWKRGLIGDIRSRLRKAIQRLTPILRYNLGLFIVLFIGAGSYIFYNTNILNDYHPREYWEQQSADGEKAYKKYEGMPLPKIISVDCTIDLFPKEARLEFSGNYILENKTNVPIDTVCTPHKDWQFNEFIWGRPNELVFYDSTLGWKIFVFDKPLEPGEKLALKFSGERKRKGFNNSGVDKLVIENGTMIQSSRLFPSFGYSSNGELRSKYRRKKYGLEPRKELPNFDDVEGNKNGLLGDNADWVDFEVVMSTDVDQIAMAPGYLQQEWVENDRRYFHYKMDKPILNFFTFVSGRYDVFKEDHNGISLEIYHHPKHTYNLETMMDAMKKSIDYYGSIYGPYPYRQCRILEFPRYSSFAQSFPNTIPFSESMGFIMDVDPNDPEDLDMPFWVTAHEMGHQWWPHQLSGGNVKGANFMSEGLSEYSAVSLLAKEKGETQLRKFLKYELDQYLNGRAFDSKEPAIIATEGNEQFIVYNKAGHTLFTLSDLIGEEIFHKALGKFIKKFRYQFDPYPNIGQFISAIREETPEDLQYLITDTFEKITLYENKARLANAFENPDGSYTLNLEVEAKKVYSDSLGVQTTAELGDWLEIGVMGEEKINGKKEEIPIYIEKVFITDSISTFEIKLDKKPFKAGIDPLFKFVDRDSKDNLIKVSFDDSQSDDN